MAPRNNRRGAAQQSSPALSPGTVTMEDIRMLMEENEKLKQHVKQVDEDNKQAREANEQAEKQIVKLQEKIKNDASATRGGDLGHGYKGRGKNTVNLGDMLKKCPQNLVNYGNLSNLLSNVIFRQYKFMPKGWEKWSERKRTMCWEVCRSVTFPAHIETTEAKSLYWAKNIVPMINKKLVTMKGNITQLMKKTFQGMCSYN